MFHLLLIVIVQFFQGKHIIAPPKQDKLNPLSASEDDILRTLDFNSGKKIDKQIVEHFSGMSPLLAKEIVHNAGLANRVTIPQAFLSIMNELKQHKYLPSITSSTTKEAFYPSFSQLLI